MTGDEMERAIEFLLQHQARLDDRMAETRAQGERTQAQIERTQEQIERTQTQVERTQARPVCIVSARPAALNAAIVSEPCLTTR
jgi:peptidoglycan hydrolase CwlO-like protein